MEGRDLKDYTAANDPNHMLRRPNGYTSKDAFADSRIPADQLQGSEADAIERGGSIEVFADEDGAKTRMDYIQAIGKCLPASAEHDFLAGPMPVASSPATLFSGPSMTPGPTPPDHATGRRTGWTGREGLRAARRTPGHSRGRSVERAVRDGRQLHGQARLQR
ncbi:hypothetical protein ABZU76_39570 [Amycolatopsis sp. NPDC005232]|uniref:hypothetical protein n=1 Tax=Amycolatopsis sp. NPDC005232 TaxID=3157027 RepID=UPI0033B27367